MIPLGRGAVEAEGSRPIVIGEEFGIARPIDRDQTTYRSIHDLWQELVRLHIPTEAGTVGAGGWTARRVPAAPARPERRHRDASTALIRPAATAQAALGSRGRRAPRPRHGVVAQRDERQFGSDNTAEELYPRRPAVREHRLRYKPAGKGAPLRSLRFHELCAAGQELEAFMTGRTGNRRGASPAPRSESLPDALRHRRLARRRCDAPASPGPSHRHRCPDALSPLSAS